MPFDPRTFFNIATDLNAKRHAQEEELRTAIGRAYYTVYGLAKVRYMVANGRSSDPLRNKEIAHFQMDHVIQRGIPVIYKSWKDLQNARKVSDYEYDSTVTKDKVRQSLRRANKVLSAIETANDAVFKRPLPASPSP